MLVASYRKCLLYFLPALVIASPDFAEAAPIHLVCGDTSPWEITINPTTRAVTAETAQCDCGGTLTKMTANAISWARELDGVDKNGLPEHVVWQWYLDRNTGTLSTAKNTTPKPDDSFTTCKLSKPL
jgi:hypothetical protein